MSWRSPLTGLFLCTLIASCGDDAAGKRLGDPCRENSECPSGVCLPAGTGRVCTDRCDDGARCPPGWNCDVFGAVTGRVCICNPAPEDPTNAADDDCDGAIDEGGGGGDCGNGACEASESCNTCPRDCGLCIDSGPPAAEIRVETAQRGSPVAADVLIHDAAGSLVAELMTDAAGALVYETVEPVSVTAVFAPNSAGARWLTTIADAAPGDLIALRGAGEPAAADVDFGSVSFTLPGATTGATEYDVTVGCTGVPLVNPTQPGTLVLRNRCVEGSTFQILATAVDAMRQPVAFSFLNDQTATMASEVTVALPAWRTDWAAVTTTLSNIPAGVSTVRASARLSYNGIVYGTIVPRFEIAPPGSDVSNVFQLPNGFSQDFIETEVQLVYGDVSAPESVAQLYRHRPTAGPLDVDVGANLLPRVHQVVMTPEPTGRHSVTWTADAPLDADAGRARLDWSVAPGSSHRWIAYFPPDSTGYTFPELPERLAPDRPPADPTLRVLFAECQSVADYRQFRNLYCPRLNPGFTGRGGDTYVVQFVYSDAR